MVQLYSDSEDARPLMYIDQNIIDSVRKGIYSFSTETFSERFRAVYSDETLKEIMRAEDGGGNACEYLDVLACLNAYHLRLELNSQFTASGNALVRTFHPRDIYEEFVQNRHYDELIESNLLFTHKIMGGLQELTVEDIIQRMLRAFEKLTQSLDQDIKLIEIFIPEAKKLLLDVFQSQGPLKVITLDEYKQVLGRLKASFTDNLDLDNAKQSALSRYREELRLNPKNLNNLEAPKIVEQVWQVISKDENIIKSGVSINQYFGLDSPNPLHPYRESFLSEKVGSIYIHLNMAGYFPDKGLHDKDRFASSFSDMQHVSLATHCDYLLSSDTRLIKKAEAAYEYTGAKTIAVLLDFNPSKNKQKEPDDYSK